HRRPRPRGAPGWWPHGPGKWSQPPILRVAGKPLARGLCAAFPLERPDPRRATVGGPLPAAVYPGVRAMVCGGSDESVYWCDVRLVYCGFGVLLLWGLGMRRLSHAGVPASALMRVGAGRSEGWWAVVGERVWGRAGVPGWGVVGSGVT